MTVGDEKEKHQALIDLVRQVVDQDNVLRLKYEVGDKFRFVKDRLHELLQHLESEQPILANDKKETTTLLAEDEVLVYVYLFNAQGVVLRNWMNMLVPKVFYEYSVNRPIFLDKSSVESLLRSKANKVQHAYLTVAIKKSDIIGELSDGSRQVKVREGALQSNKLLTLTHNDQDYYINADGELVKR